MPTLGRSAWRRQAPRCTVYSHAEYLAGMRGLPAASTVPEGHGCHGSPTACAPKRNVAEFPAGIGHNNGFRSVTPAQLSRTTTEGDGSPKMATDYDSPRKTDDDLTEDSLQELQARRMDKSSSTIDLDPDDVAESLELPGADLSNEELSFRVIPRQADEFTCSRCFLVHHRSQLAEERGGQLICHECAA
jgi:hypothetical protein